LLEIIEAPLVFINGLLVQGMEGCQLAVPHGCPLQLDGIHLGQVAVLVD